MFSKIGDNIKTLAKILTVVGILASIIGAISLWVQAGELSSIYSSEAKSILNTNAWVVLIGGSLGSWIGSFVLYGFGQLIDDTASIKDSLRNLAVTATIQEEKGTWRSDTNTTEKHSINELKYPKIINEETKTAQVDRSYATISCPFCKAMQRPDRTSCYKCNAKFVGLDEE